MSPLENTVERGPIATFARNITDRLIRPSTAVIAAGALVVAACGGEDEAETGSTLPPVTTIEGGAGVSTSTEDSSTEDDEAVSEDTVDTVADLEEQGLDNETALRKRLKDSGLDEDAIADIVDVKGIVENSAETCIDYVDRAMTNDVTVDTEHGTFIDRSEVSSAGIKGGLISNGGVNQFTDSLGRDYKEGEGDDRQEVASYFAQGVSNENIRIEALQEAMARLCASPEEAASGAVMIANAELGNTGVRLGEIFTGLEEYVVEGERTEEKMDEKYAVALTDFIGEPDSGNEEVVESYNTQQEKAATMAAILGSLGNFINSGAITVQESTVAYGATEDRVTLRHSTTGTSGDRGQTLGGEYESQTGESLVFVWESKAGCIVIDGLTVNMLDGRYGYTAFVSTPEGCEPIVVVVPTPPTPPEPEVPGRKGVPGDTLPATENTTPPNPDRGGNNPDSAPEVGEPDETPADVEVVDEVPDDSDNQGDHSEQDTEAPQSDSESQPTDDTGEDLDEVIDEGAETEDTDIDDGDDSDNNGAIDPNGEDSPWDR